jgi:hypothetical protein
MAKLLRRYVVAESGCWEWTGTRNRFGYGLICVGTWYAGHITTVGAHRLQWERHNGPAPKGQHVMHRCDNRLCINPGHLRLGTPADNIHDMMAKGRQNFAGLRNFKGP